MKSQEPSGVRKDLADLIQRSRTTPDEPLPQARVMSPEEYRRKTAALRAYMLFAEERAEALFGHFNVRGLFDQIRDLNTEGFGAGKQEVRESRPFLYDQVVTPANIHADLTVPWNLRPSGDQTIDGVDGTTKPMDLLEKFKAKYEPSTVNLEELPTSLEEVAELLPDITGFSISYFRTRYVRTEMRVSRNYPVRASHPDKGFAVYTNDRISSSIPDVRVKATFGIEVNAVLNPRGDFLEFQPRSATEDLRPPYTSKDVVSNFYGTPTIRSHRTPRIGNLDSSQYGEKIRIEAGESHDRIKQLVAASINDYINR